MTLEHTLRRPLISWPGAGRVYTIITPATANRAPATQGGTAPAQPRDETRRLMVQGLRLLAGVWDDAEPPLQAQRCMESLGLRAISLDEPSETLPCDEGERPARTAIGDYDIALALRTPTTRTALRQRVRRARQALRPAGTLALATLVIAPGDDLRDTTTSSHARVGDDADSAIRLPTVRSILTDEGFIARVFAWQSAPTLAELAPVEQVALPTPRRLLVIASLGDDADARRIRLRSA